MKNNKSIHEELKSFLKKENFSEDEIALLVVFMEEKKIKPSHSLLKKKNNKKALESLLKKKIIRAYKENGNSVYSLDSLESFFAWIKTNTSQKINNLRHQTNTFIDHLRFSLGDAVKSKITFYEGVEGIMDSYRHILEHAEKEVCAYYSVLEAVQPELQLFFDNEFAIKRAQKGIFSRNIAPKTPTTTYFKLRSKEAFMEIRLLPPKLLPLLNGEVNIYGKYIHCMAYNEKGGFALVIEDESLSRLQKAIFEIAWESSKYALPGKFLYNIPQEESSDILKEHIYVTDNIKSILQNINSRKDKFPANLREKWADAKAEYITTPEGGRTLKVCGLEVMSDFETPYMKELAKIGTMHGGKILDIFFGLGLASEAIEKLRKTRKITEHHITVKNKEILKQAKKWRNAQPHKDKIFIHEGGWENILPKLQKEGHVFDGVIFNGFPLEIDDIGRCCVRFLYSLLKLQLVKEKTGIITFYMDSIDGFGNSFQKYLQMLGIRDVRAKKIDIKLPKRGCEYWNESFFLAPLLTDIKYPENTI